MITGSLGSGLKGGSGNSIKVPLYQKDTIFTEHLKNQTLLRGDVPV